MYIDHCFYCCFCICFVLHPPSSIFIMKLYVPLLPRMHSNCIHIYVYIQCTYVASSFPARSREVHSIQLYVMKCVIDLKLVGFLRLLWFRPPIKLTATTYLTWLIPRVTLNTNSPEMTLYLYIRILLFKDENTTRISIFARSWHDNYQRKTKTKTNKKKWIMGG